MRDQKWQEGIEGSPTTEKGNFTQVPNEVIEYLMNRKKADLTSREYSIMFFLIRELQGWAYELKPIEISDFVAGTGMEKQNVIPSLATLVEERRLVRKFKLPGFRTPLYGFNKEIFGRILASQEPKKFFSAGNGKVINLMTFKVLNSMPLEVINSMTEKRRLAALGAAERASKDTSNTCKYNLREISLFLETQRKQTRNRWESIIDRVLTDYPKDEWLLWTAIDLVHKTRQDLFGKPIRRSIIGLFDGDWSVMRVAMEAKLNQIELEAAKQRKREDPYNPCTNSVQPLYESRTEKESQDFETIDENRCLNTLLKDISLKTEQKGDGESFTLLGELGTKPKRTPEEQARIIREQIRQAKAGTLG